jgi:fatty-acyl-CoA synthase
VRQADAHWGEVPVAFVVRADEEMLEADVIALLRGRIANYKLPKRVVFVAADAMPRSPLGKIQRQLLEERLRAEAA